MIPSNAHNIQAGKNAPNNSNEGAPMLALVLMVTVRGVAYLRAVLGDMCTKVVRGR
jgi:hypothetical protein